MANKTKTSSKEKFIDSTKQYLNWPGMQYASMLAGANTPDPSSMTDDWTKNKNFLNWPGLKYAVNGTGGEDSNIWDENREFLSLQSLQYLWYSKMIPYASQKHKDEKGDADDEGWWIAYGEDSSAGIVYMTLDDDSSTFYFDQDGSCGGIQDYNGMLQVVVDRDYSKMIDGSIHQDGSVYVNFSTKQSITHIGI